ncbi:MAG: hypothetical protein KIT62_10915 [Cyclobacteriaceae bacterium]|nr:hypothetical protein [Cyclobacteriaceae bacterium]
MQYRYRQHIRTCFFIFVAGLLLHSCSPKQYTWVHTTQKPTFFEKQHDFEFSINGSQIGELHGAYAITNNLAVSLTGAWGSAGRDTTSFLLYDSLNNNIGRAVLKPKVQDIDFAIGYFKALNEKWHFEIFSGVSIVSLSITEEDNIFATNETTKSKISNENLYVKYYIQPALGKNYRNYDFGFVSRISFIDYRVSNSDFMIEPSVFVRYGYRNVKLMTQMGLRLNTQNGVHDYTSVPITFGMGLYLQLNKNIKGNP